MSLVNYDTMFVTLYRRFVGVKGVLSLRYPTVDPKSRVRSELSEGLRIQSDWENHYASVPHAPHSDKR